MRLENHNIYNAPQQSRLLKVVSALKFNAWKMMNVILVALHKTFIMQAISRIYEEIRELSNPTKVRIFASFFDDSLKIQCGIRGRKQRIKKFKRLCDVSEN